MLDVYKMNLKTYSPKVNAKLVLDLGLQGTSTSRLGVTLVPGLGFTLDPISVLPVCVPAINITDGSKEIKQKRKTKTHPKSDSSKKKYV